jgi:effector-binding domain-containing protein
MLETPQVLFTEAQQSAAIRFTVPLAQFQGAFDAATSELTDALASQGIEAAGPAYSYFFAMPGALFDMEIGVPVAAPVSTCGRVRAGALPAMRVARAVCRGAMEGGAAWGELKAWIDANGHAAQAFMWERYVVGADAGTEPAAWRTELNWPLEDPVLR